jgi:hypothetical protein
MSNTYYNSPFGIAVHPWINKADTKFNADGVFKLGLALGGEEAVSLKQRIDEEAEAAIERYWETKDGSKVLPKDRKHWKAYVPYTVEEDDAGNPTGFIEFKFKQNQKLKLKDGSTKVLTISIVDSSGDKKVRKPVYGGTELRVRYTMRDVVIKTDKKIGVQLAFNQVQVRKLAEQTQGGGGFDAVDGYVEDDEAFEGNENGAAGDAPSASTGDY